MKFASTYINEDIANTCVSRDGLRVGFELSFQYQMTEENLYPAVIRYRDFYKWAEVVESAGRSAIQHACSEFNIASFQNQRGFVQTRMFENIKLKLEGDPTKADDFGVYAKAVSSQLRFLRLPSEYQQAVSAKQEAEEDIVFAINQRKQNITQSETELLLAELEAQKILESAANDAELMIMEAKLAAQETLYAYEQEAAILLDIKDSLGLTTEALLAYTATMLIEETSRLSLSAGEPARLSRKDELQQGVPQIGI